MRWEVQVRFGEEGPGDSATTAGLSLNWRLWKGGCIWLEGSPPVR